jgi:hypothetical protein
MGLDEGRVRVSFDRYGVFSIYDIRARFVNGANGGLDIGLKHHVEAA